MKIVLVGIYPPPIGGVSVHIKRLYQNLMEKKEEVTLFAQNHVLHGKREPGIFQFQDRKAFYRKAMEADIVHFHQIDLKLFYTVALLRLCHKRLFLTVHNERTFFGFEKRSRWEQKKLLLYLRMFDRVICMTGKVKKTFAEKGMPKNRVMPIPAYIHPLVDVNAPRNREIDTFVGDADFAICANGRISLEVKPEIYGIDMMVELMRVLGRKYNVKLVLLLPDKSGRGKREQAYFKRLLKKREEYGLVERILIKEVEEFDFTSILPLFDIYIRPTNTDGFSLSISEALHLGVPVVASDVCRREEGTILFRNRDQEDFNQKVEAVIKDCDTYKQRTRALKVKDYFELLYQDYKKMVSRHSK